MLIIRNAKDRTEWTDNGNGNYCNVYFRIDTKGFECMHTYFTEEQDRNTFHAEASEIISKFGIVEDCGLKHDSEYLYAHPQNISGIVAKSKIAAIAEAINDSTSMTIRWVDVYEEYAIISDDEYRKILETKRADMAKYIIEQSATKRTNQYVFALDVATRTQERFKENRLNAREDINRRGMTCKFAMEIIKQLVNEGYLLMWDRDNDGEYYIRSLNKTEQKKTKTDYDFMYIIMKSVVKDRLERT